MKKHKFEHGDDYRICRHCLALEEAKTHFPPDKPSADAIYLLKAEISAMKHRLATSELLKEAEAMGFEIEIKLPTDSSFILWRRAEKKARGEEHS